MLALSEGSMACLRCMDLWGCRTLFMTLRRCMALLVDPLADDGVGEAISRLVDLGKLPSADTGRLQAEADESASSCCISGLLLGWTSGDVLSDFLPAAFLSFPPDVGFRSGDGKTDEVGEPTTNLEDAPLLPFLCSASDASC